MKGCNIIMPMLLIGLIAAGIVIYGSEFDNWFKEVTGNSEETGDEDDSGNNSDGSPSFSSISYIQCDDPELCCNGLTSNCDKRVNEIMFATSHNAMSTVEDNFVGANHLRKLEASLENGFRAFMLDLCSCNGVPSFCHGSCFFGERNPADVFEAIVVFLNENPSEIIILEFQVNENGDLFALYDIMEAVEGFVNRIYVHDGSDEWPLLSTLVSSDKRILLFQHDGANCNIDGNCPEGFMWTYTHMFQTSFEIDNSEDLLNVSGCSITRGQSTNAFFILNHFLEDIFPSYEDAEIINQMEILQNRTELCSNANDSKTVNLLAVDFWTVGEVAQFVLEHNKSLL